MGVVKWLKTIRDGYVKRQVAGFSVPMFSEEEPMRRQYVFGGRVQKVGFRMEVALLAQRLGLTGMAQNLPDGRVLVQLQGTPQRMAWLKNRMCTLRRIRVTQCEETEMPFKENEQTFVIVRTEKKKK